MAAPVVSSGVLVVKKAWGEEHVFAATESYSGKLMRLTPGCRSSLHRHRIKDESFMVLRGMLHLEIDDVSMVLGPGDGVRIQPGQWHRFANPSSGRVEFVEAGTRHDDADVERRGESGPLP